jgi:hypothetical protein
VIQKSGKGDYSIPKAHRPISLLRILSKGLEKIVARRISDFLERTGQLPRTSFGARPQRSTDQALIILVERIYNAWHIGKVLLLVTFDIQRVYNEVNKEVLQERILKLGIPETIVR